MRVTNRLYPCVLAAMLACLLAGCGHPPSQSTNASAPTAVPAAATLDMPTVGQPQASVSAAGATTKVVKASTPANAPADSPVKQQIRDVLGGNPKAYLDVFNQLQQAMATGDKAGVAALVAYPITVMLHGKSKRISNAKELIANWDQIVTPEIKQAVANQKFSKLFINAQNGAMIGNGQVWINGVCKDEACSSSDIRITTIQSVADNTPSAVKGGPATSVASAPTSATKPCAGADVGLAAARKTTYAALVSKAVEGKAKPTDITIERYMAIDGWTVVLADTPIADPGWFVFDTAGGGPRFKDVWGGMADESDRPGLVKWASALGAPASFAQCFAQTIIG